MISSSRQTKLYLGGRELQAFVRISQDNTLIAMGVYVISFHSVFLSGISCLAVIMVTSLYFNFAEAQPVITSLRFFFFLN